MRAVQPTGGFLRSGHKIIGIHFYDNDNYPILNTFLKLLSYECSTGSFNLTKENVVKAFNISAIGIYVIQNGFQKHFDFYSMNEFLKIKEEHVLFDEEVTEYFKECNGNSKDWNGSEFFWIVVGHDYSYTF